ncbi:CoA-binding protein [Salinirubellus sp. GCM10025818]|mgnify:CR=1 FL=1|jgi:predicted CoA-binding protein|uniref:CoA-binding protein n=1 Tax=Salinirubellus TaxID=2162630 RepID=UPI0030CE3EBE
MPATTEQIREILDYETVAVVGCSTTPGKAAHDIPKYLLDHGYEVIPINPYADEIFGIEAYDSLEDVPEGVDIVDVFRPSEETGPIVDAAAEREDVKAIWLQLGIRNDEAGERAEAAGKLFVQDECIKVEHGKLAA